jgi:hypothetical protein
LELHVMACESERAPVLGEREARAERYFSQDLAGQREWYGNRASSYKRWAQLLAVLVIGAGSATSFLQVFSARPWVPIATAALGAIVAVAEGWQRIAGYSEAWTGYRTASERMKRERRLYVNGAGAYRGLPENEGYLLFVEAVEAILAEEQQIFWRARERGDGAARQPGSAAPAKAPEHA